MGPFLHPLKGVATVALAVVAAIIGARLSVRAAGEPRAVAPAAPRRAEPAQPVQPPVKPLVGIVRDPDGRPVAGATVVAGQFGGGEPNHRIGTTGTDGRFELTPAGKSTVLDFAIPYKEGLAPASVLQDPRPGRAKDGEAVLQLAHPAPFLGVVKDREGRPIAGATVRVREVQYPGANGPQTMLNALEWIVAGTPLERIFRTTTDAQGRFRFAELPRGAGATLIVTAAGMGEYNTNNRRRPDGGFGHQGTAEAPAQVVLAPAARVVGRVVTRFPSVKVGGLKVAIQGSHESHGIWGEARTDGEGRFALDGLDEGTANIFLMDRPNDGPWTYRAAADTELKPGQTSEVEIELIRGAQVEGRVVDADSGLPVAGVGVGLYGPIRPRSGAAIISAKTDHAGRYRFRLPPGETYIYICGPVPPEYGQRYRGAQTVNIPADAREFTVPPIEIRKEGREG
jgi:hypothetical protein